MAWSGRCLLAPALTGTCPDRRIPKLFAVKHRDPAGGREIGSKRDRQLPIAAAKHDHCNADDRADNGGHQDDDVQHLPAEPGSERGEEFEIAISHALLTGNQLEQLIDGPEAQITRESADNGVLGGR